MRSAEARILTINGGSSSLKFAIFAADGSAHQVLEGEITRIGLAGSMFRVTESSEGPAISRPVVAPDHARAVSAIIGWLDEHGGEGLVAIGHRVVHGGPKYAAPERITPAVLDELRRIGPFDPDHLPAEILLIEAFAARFPELPQLACFDTAFHHDLPRVAKLLPIPRRYEAQGVRRYGFHGLSYAFLMSELTHAGSQAAAGRVVLAHLGSGASLAAVRGGHPIDTSMGFTPTAGVPMSTRSGDLDPGVLTYLARTEGFDARRLDELVNTQSGLLGMSETSSDVRDLLEREAHDVRAAEALAVFCYQVKKWIGAFAAALGGIDTLVFAGGIGENAPLIRARICDGLSFLGIELDATRNAASERVISTSRSAASVRVIRTDEAQMIARAVGTFLGID